MVCRDIATQRFKIIARHYGQTFTVFRKLCLVPPCEESDELTGIGDGLAHSASYIHCGPKDYPAVEWMAVGRSRTTLVDAPLITRRN